MAFVDELKVHMKSGRGGNGVVRWRREKFIDKGGPNGGDGGRGGNVYVVAVRSMHTLAKYKHQKEFKAGVGEPGGGTSLHGANGDDMVIDLPVGSVITRKGKDSRYSLDTEGQKIMILRGGSGGYGNEHFKSSTNTTPIEWTAGRDGDEADFYIELELFADLGLVGLPNAGKSSLLNTLTNATAKVGSYEFTTLEPNLGALGNHIIADIPGLIEGASEGRGLGVKFLRHIKRTKMLAHLVSFENLSKEKKEEKKSFIKKMFSKSESENGMMKVYKDIRKELETYDNKNKLGHEGLSTKDEVIILTKTDVVDAETISEIKKEFEKLGNPVLSLSLYDDASIKALEHELLKLLEKIK
ncbi:MAG: GTPase ObgE [Candidatus Paceibacterota bacterium]|jgi:GTP-binding protein